MHSDMPLELGSTPIGTEEAFNLKQAGQNNYQLLYSSRHYKLDLVSKRVLYLISFEELIIIIFPTHPFVL